MFILLGGVISVILGVFLMILLWEDFLSFLAGGVPVVVTLGGLLAIYFGLDELRFRRFKEAEVVPSPQESVEERPAGEPKEEAAEAVEEGRREEVEEAPEEVTEEKEEAPERQYWILGYSAKNIQIVAEKGIIALPTERAEVIKEEMKPGDHVILYALSPHSRFVGIIEVKGAYRVSSDMPFQPLREGEVWEHQRPVSMVKLLEREKWIEAKGLLPQLQILKEARERGTDLSRSFASKLRGVIRISKEDYELISSYFENA